MKHERRVKAAAYKLLAAVEACAERFENAKEFNRTTTKTVEDWAAFEVQDRASAHSELAGRLAQVEADLARMRDELLLEAERIRSGG